MEKERQKKNIFRIDKNGLDVECENQASLFHQLAELHATLEDMATTAKATMEMVYAQVSLTIRKEPQKFVKDGKLNNEIVDSLVKVSKQYQEAQAEYHRLMKEASLAKAGTMAMEHKKRMIEKLVDLHGRDYFSTPKTEAKKDDGFGLLEKPSDPPKKKKKLQGKKNKFGEIQF